MKVPFKKNRISVNVTLFRILITLILFYILVSKVKTDLSIYLFAITAFLSFFERFFYKKKKSQLRSIFDLLADKLLVNLTLAAVYINGMLPWWVLAIVLGRDAVTIVGGAFLLAKDHRKEFSPTKIGKLTLFLQVISLVPVLLTKVDWILMGIALLFTVVSFIEILFVSEFKITRKPDISELFKIQHLIKLADLFTLANVMGGVIAIMFAIQERYAIAMVALIGAVIADFFDGKVARTLNQQNSFGKELDSLADTISFGVAPTIIGFTLIETPFAIFCFTIFLFCGILRLARFNVMQRNERFEGMPITVNGVLIPVIYLMGVPASFYPYIYIALGILMVSSISFKKF